MKAEKERVRQHLCDFETPQILHGFHRQPVGYREVANQILRSCDNDKNNGNKKFVSKWYVSRMERGMTTCISPCLPSIPEDVNDNEMLHREVMVCFNTINIVLTSIINSTVIKFRKQKHFRLSVLALMSVLLCFSILIHVSLRTPSLRENNIKMQILMRNISSVDTFLNGSPQSKALQWIANLDTMKLDNYDEKLPVRYSLAVFYYSMSKIDDKADWDDKTWLSGQDVCQWKGIKCKNAILNSNTTEVIGLNLTSIRGQLPGMEWTALNQLEWLHLGKGNQISGTIPSELGELTKLVILSLGNNQLTGSIPSEITKLINLEMLGLQNNQLSSTIPVEIENLSNLAVAYFDNNQISGVIPTTVGKLKNRLVDLRLNNNLLEGSIPPEIASLSQLHLLYLNANNLNGSLPQELSTMTSLRLLQVEDNEIIGQVPSSVCNTVSHHGHKMIIQVDCSKVFCSCCAYCGWNTTIQ